MNEKKQTMNIKKENFHVPCLHTTLGPNGNWLFEKLDYQLYVYLLMQSIV